MENGSGLGGRAGQNRIGSSVEASADLDPNWNDVLASTEVRVVKI